MLGLIGSHAAATLSLLLPSVVCLAFNHPTSDPYEIRPSPDGLLPHLILPTPPGVLIEKDVGIAMPDGVKLACNAYRPDKPGKFPVILSMTPYGKDLTPPVYMPEGTPLPGAYPSYIARLYAHGADMGHMRISSLASFEAPDPAFWVPNDYVVLIVDQRGGFKSGGKTPTPAQRADDLYAIVEWAAAREWSTGNIGMMGVSALAWNQYDVASRDPAPPHLKAIVPWEGASNVYRDFFFWGGIPETNFSRSLGPFKAELARMAPGQAAKAWAAAMDPVVNQGMMQAAPRLERITLPTLLCASWSDKGLHTQGSFEAWRRIASRDKWLYTHGGKKWERFYSQDATDYQKRFFDYYLKGLQNGWQDTPRVRLEIRETRDEYTVRPEEEFPLARTQYKKLYLDALDGSMSPSQALEGKIVYQSTRGGSASFGVTFDEETEVTGYMKVRLWVAAEDADDMDLFVIAKKFAGPCDADNAVCASLEAVVGKDGVAKGNEIQFRGMNGFYGDAAARGQMRVSQREPDDSLSTPWMPVQKFQGEKKLKAGEIVPVEIALLPSSTLFRKGESLVVSIQGYGPVDQPLLFYDWLVSKGRHAIYTGGTYDSYVQIPVVQR